MYWLPFGMMIMEVDKSTFKMPKSAIRALIAHELAHYKHYFSERKADMKVLEIGMGKGLLKFHKYHNKRFEQYTEKEALTTKEIKQYLNENQTQPSRRL